MKKIIATLVASLFVMSFAFANNHETATAENTEHHDTAAADHAEAKATKKAKKAAKRAAKKAHHKAAAHDAAPAAEGHETHGEAAHGH